MAAGQSVGTTVGSPCPNCGQDVLKWGEQSRQVREGTHSLKMIKERAWGCNGCGYAIRPSKNYLSEEETQEEGLPGGCRTGHRSAWRLVRLVGNRRDYQCGFMKNADICMQKASVGPFTGFLNPTTSSAPYGSTSFTVIEVLGRRGGATASQITRFSGLSPGQVQGALARQVDRGAIERTMQLLVPRGKAYVYSLRVFGGMIYEWLKARGQGEA